MSKNEKQYSISEVANMLGVSNNAIKKRIKKHSIKTKKGKKRGKGFERMLTKNAIEQLSDEMKIPINDGQIKLEASISPRTEGQRKSEPVTKEISNEVINILKDQISDLREDKKDLSKKIDVLMERQKEQNILMRGFQEKLGMIEYPQTNTTNSKDEAEQVLETLEQENIEAYEEYEKTQKTKKLIFDFIRWVIAIILLLVVILYWLYNSQLL